MNLVKWDPFRELEEISNRLNRLFAHTPARGGSGQEILAMADWTPSVDISETEAAYLVSGDIPGVRKADVRVTVDKGMITISGERKQEKEEKDRKFHRIERTYGSFTRSFRLPGDVDESAIRAEFKDGMINVALPKSAKARAKAVEISVS